MYVYKTWFVIAVCGLVAILSGCKEGLLDAGGQKLYSKVDLTDAVQLSSGAITVSALPLLTKAGVIEVPNVEVAPKVDIKNTFVQEKPFVEIDRVTVFDNGKIPKGYKKTVTYTKTDGKTKVTEVAVTEPVLSQDPEVPIERLIIAILGTSILFLLWIILILRKVKP